LWYAVLLFPLVTLAVTPVVIFGALLRRLDGHGGIAQGASAAVTIVMTTTASYRDERSLERFFLSIETHGGLTTDFE